MRSTSALSAGAASNDADSEENPFTGKLGFDVNDLGAISCSKTLLSESRVNCNLPSGRTSASIFPHVNEAADGACCWCWCWCCCRPPPPSDASETWSHSLSAGLRVVAVIVVVALSSSSESSAEIKSSLKSFPAGTARTRTFVVLCCVVSCCVVSCSVVLCCVVVW